MTRRDCCRWGVRSPRSLIRTQTRRYGSNASSPVIVLDTSVGSDRRTRLRAIACPLALLQPAHSSHSSRRIVCFLQRPKYEVLDMDTGEGDGEGDGTPVRQKKYVLDLGKIVPLPSLEAVPMHARREFQKGERVRAVFPTGGITTLYPAEVIAGPKKVRLNNSTAQAAAAVRQHKHASGSERLQVGSKKKGYRRCCSSPSLDRSLFPSASAQEQHVSAQVRRRRGCASQRLRSVRHAAHRIYAGR